MYVLVSDFAHFRLRNVETGVTTGFALDALPYHIQDLALIAGYGMRARPR